MRVTQLQNIDLNLLPALAALLEERHISRAAERTGLSQSAMSRALQRLRRTLDDDLLVRDGGGYRLTPRAERIREQLGTVIPRLSEIFTEDAFDPAELQQTIHLCGSDYAVDVVGVPLIRYLLDAAPRATVCFHAWHAGSLDQLARGDLDLVFVGAQAPGALRSRALFDDRFVCLVAVTHPLARYEGVDLEQYLAHRHLVVDITDGRQPAVDHVLAARGTPRDVAATVPFHAVAPAALAGTSLVLTFPQRLTGAYADQAGIRVLAAPPEISTMSYRMAWHPRYDSDPAHRWLRDIIRSVTGSP
jgi:DNA-binding transcriptional LysR family regulator